MGGRAGGVTPRQRAPYPGPSRGWGPCRGQQTGWAWAAKREDRRAAGAAETKRLHCSHLPSPQWPWRTWSQRGCQEGKKNSSLWREDGAGRGLELPRHLKARCQGITVPGPAGPIPHPRAASPNAASLAAPASLGLLHHLWHLSLWPSQVSKSPHWEGFPLMQGCSQSKSKWPGRVLAGASVFLL